MAQLGWPTNGRYRSGGMRRHQLHGQGGVRSHDYLSTDSEGDIAGWGAGGTIGVIANDGLQAVQLCRRSSFSFGKSKDDRGTLRESINSTPIEVCAEFPAGF